MKMIIALLGSILIVCGFWYLLCSFIAWDFNPTHWLLFIAFWGRICFIFFVLPGILKGLSVTFGIIKSEL